jgi:hypothetical protein
MGFGDFLKEAAGVVVTGIAEGALVFVPGGGLALNIINAKRAADTLGEISKRHLYIANNCTVPVSVIVAPNKDWVAADLVGTLVSLVVSLGSSAPSGLAGLKAAKSLYDVYQATRYIRGTASVVTTLWQFFSKRGCQVESRQLECVNQRSNTNPLDYMTPSQFGTLAGASDVSVYIITQDGRTAFFNTNSDAAWVVDEDGIKRAKTGKTWEVEPSQGVVAWNA